MKTLNRRDKALVRHVMRHGQKTEAQALAYLDKHGGDWRGTPKPKAHRLKPLGTGEIE